MLNLEEDGDVVACERCADWYHQRCVRDHDEESDGLINALATLRVMKIN